MAGRTGRKGYGKKNKKTNRGKPQTVSRSNYGSGSHTVKGYAAEQAKKARRKPPAKPKKSPKPKTPALRANAAHRVPPSAAKAAKVGSRLLGKGPASAAGAALLGISALHALGSSLGGKPDPKTNKKRGSGTGAAKPRRSKNINKRPAPPPAKKPAPPKTQTRKRNTKSSFGAAFKAARKAHGGAGGVFTWKGKAYQTNIKGESYVKNPKRVKGHYKPVKRKKKK
jgi:hypothetical protein